MVVARSQTAAGSDGGAMLRHRRPVQRFGALCTVGLAAMIAGAVVLRVPAPAVIAAGGVLAAALIASAIMLDRGHPHSRVGAANVITLLRLAIVGVLLSILLAGAGRPEIVIPLSVVALGLDGVDGHLARRQRLASRFGASFDTEVDSAFALVLALLAVAGPAGPIALVLGLPRYLFWAAGRVMPWLNGPLEPRFSRKVVCVLQLIVLIVLQLPALPVWLALALVVAAAGFLAWSFGDDIRFLRSRRVPARRRHRDDADGMPAGTPAEPGATDSSTPHRNAEGGATRREEFS